MINREKFLDYLNKKLDSLPNQDGVPIEKVIMLLLDYYSKGNKRLIFSVKLTDTKLHNPRVSEVEEYLQRQYISFEDE